MASDFPISVVQEESQGTYLYTVVDGKAKKTSVTVSQTYNGQAEVSKGLKPGDKIIVTGFQGVSDGTPVVIR